MKYIIPTLLVLFLAACTPTQAPIASFDECVAAGHAVMESQPRQCTANGQTFTEQVSEDPIVTPQFTLCQDPRPEACTMEYMPVCAIKDNGIRCITTPCPSTDAVTAGNACSACGDKDVIGHYPGACEDLRMAICESDKNIDILPLIESSGWICVDTCPKNMDAYTTQIGVQLCITHYGADEISTWETCERSTPNCDCVRAYETTDDQPIEDAAYRCVPQQYAERMLFRAGVDRLDEQGRQSVAIA
ncbi:MAG: hypothetical protein ABIH41_00290 [Nanoarchaeota archaeon]